ncbi:MAG: hypothetical protein AAFO94_22760, partial [Bacteroidota bacterium]
KIGEKTWLSKADGFRNVPTFNWHKSRNLSPQENAKQKYAKHKGAFPELKSLQLYINAANQMIRKPPAGTREKKMSNGDKILYDERSNVITVSDKDGLPKTMFRPVDKLDYFLAVGEDKKTKYGDRWVAAAANTDGAGPAPSDKDKGVTMGAHRSDPKTAISKAAVKGLEPNSQMARGLSSRKSWDAIEQLMVEADLITAEEARKLNAFKSLIPSNAERVADFASVPEGSLIGFFKELTSAGQKKEQLILVMVSLGNGRAAGVGNKVIGVGELRAWEEIDLNKLDYNKQGKYI